MELRPPLSLLCLLMCWSLPLSASGGERAAGEEEPTFERHIRPILRAHCLDCHGAVEEEIEGSLDLRLVRLMQTGGDSGPAIVPGEPDQSYLLDRVRSGEMPPGEGKLSDEELHTLERWIAAGAPTARPEPETIGPGVPILPEEREWWAFQPIERPQVPEFPPEARVRTPVDALLLQEMPEELSFSSDAEKRALMMRVYFDLIGLPPSPEEAERFLNDDSPDAYERLVEELLDSPHYGERWARHWLDVAGYADSEGRTSTDAPRAWAYKFRDYVVRSLNDDKPIDLFLHEQLAGDELAGPIEGDLTEEQIELLTATGFLRMAADGTGSGDNSEEARNQVVADTLKIVSSSLLGLSFACAQCHDHRYDPISHTDYFALRAIFDPALDWRNWKTPQQRFVSLYTRVDREQAAQVEAEAQAVVAERDEQQKRYIAEALEKELEKFEEPLRGELREAYEAPADERSEEQKALLAGHPSVNISPGVLYQYNQEAADDLKKYGERIEEIRSRKPPEEFLRALTEPAGHVPETKLFHRGDHRQPKQTVLPAATAVLTPEDVYLEFPVDDPERPTTGRRLAFARWLTSEQNPMTARVLANRVWLHLFGRGLVETPADFGRLGSRPTHPELLDWLASEFMAQGWSLKQLHRTILLSTAYRQSSFRETSREAIDSDNHFYWRKPVRRLDAEIVRDRILAATGQLDRTLFGPAVPVKENESGQAVVEGTDRRRSLYVQQRRTQPVAMLQAFDAPVMETNCEQRPSSTVATQSLMLMNGEFVLTQSQLLAERVRNEEASPLPDELVEGLPPVSPPPAPLWQFGYGSFDQSSGQTAQFTHLPHFEGSTWQGGPERPDPKLGWVLLNAAGGHTGNNPDFAAIRRWTAPQSGTLKISGTLHHPSENGDGVRGRIVSSRSGLAGEWITHNSQAATAIDGLPVQSGDTIDFITDCRGDVNSDSFQWTVELQLTTEEKRTLTWNSSDGFRGPQPSSPELRLEHLARAWELAYCRPPSQDELELAVGFLNRQLDAMRSRTQPLPENVSATRQALANLCQALLTSNEFLYVE